MTCIWIDLDLSGVFMWGRRCLCGKGVYGVWCLWVSIWERCRCLWGESNGGRSGDSSEGGPPPPPNITNTTLLGTAIRHCIRFRLRCSAHHSVRVARDQKALYRASLTSAISTLRPFSSSSSSHIHRLVHSLATAWRLSPLPPWRPAETHHHRRHSPSCYYYCCYCYFPQRPRKRPSRFQRSHRSSPRAPHVAPSTTSA